MLITQFTTDEEEDSPAEKSESEYAFEGFNIEFSEKIALTPLKPKSGPVAQGQSISRSFRLEPQADKPNPQIDKFVPPTEFGPTPRRELPKKEFDRINDAQDRLEARKKITDLAAGSASASFRWSVGSGREVAPIGYIKGMALVYAKVYCKFRAGDAAASEMAIANTGDAATDALAHLDAEFTAAGMRNDVAGADTLRHVFVLMMSQGMRESAGRHCQGRDQSANNTTAETAEAGLFQTSFNARGAHALMPQLFQQYKANPAGFVEVFREGVTCTNVDLQNFGAGDGKEFQRLSKACPAFAAEFTAVGLRNRRQHWGSINKKTVEIRPEADDMLKQVQDLVDAQNLCPLL
jgi:hypothetical protein